MTNIVDATTFPDAEVVVAAALKEVLLSAFVDNTTPSPIVGDTVIVGFSGGGGRAWGEAAVNVGINVYALTEKECRDLTLLVQNILAVTSNGSIEMVSVPAGGGTSIPRQSPPFQRYFAATVRLRGQAVIDPEDFDPS